MNPLLKQSIANLNGKYSFSEHELLIILFEMGNLAHEVAAGVRQNPNANLNGGNYIDEDTLGNFIIHETKYKIL